jgi:siroheme synthase
VFLVGTGPGDPGLLTLRAVQLMQTADVVLYDRLVSDDILQLVHGGARMVYVGKQAGYHTRTQVCGSCLQDPALQGGCGTTAAVVAAHMGQSNSALT